MSDLNPLPVHGSDPQAQPPQGCVLRLFWMAFGNLLLLVFAALIAKTSPWTFTVMDLGYWAIAALLMLARFLDITRFGGETSSGTPATRSHFNRYAIGLSLTAVAMWLAVQSVVV